MTFPQSAIALRNSAFGHKLQDQFEELTARSDVRYTAPFGDPDQKEFAILFDTNIGLRTGSGDTLAVALLEGDEHYPETLAVGWHTHGIDFVPAYSWNVPTSDNGHEVAQSISSRIEKFAIDHGLASAKPQQTIETATKQTLGLDLPLRTALDQPSTALPGIFPA